MNSRIPSSVLHGALPAIDGSNLTGISVSTFNGQNASYYLDYNNFTNTPTLITNNNQLTNGAGYITASSSDTLTNKSGNISMFTNDSNYLTSVPAQTFASLTDTPANFTGHGGKFVKVNVGENALEFVTSGSSQNAFSTIAVAGQSNVEADSVGDTLNLVAGTNVTITTVAGTDSVTINSTASGLTNLVDDTTPELGGNLSLNSKNVTGTGNINITGSLTATSGTLGSIQLIDNNIKSTDSTQLSIQTPTSFTNSGAPGVTIDGNITFEATGAITGPTVDIYGIGNGQVKIGNTGSSINPVKLGNSNTAVSVEGDLTVDDEAKFQRGIQHKYSTIDSATGVTAHDCNNGQFFRHTNIAGDITVNLSLIHI